MVVAGVGVLIFRRCNGCDVFSGGDGADITKLGFGVDSSYQNLAEFTGAVLSLVCIVKLGMLREVKDIRGDSISSLIWIEKERYKKRMFPQIPFLLRLLPQPGEAIFTLMIST